MTKLGKTDLFMTEDGDIELSNSFLSFGSIEYRNIKTIREREALLQTIKVRLISSDPDVPDLTAKDFCANLEDLIGLPNTVETAKLGVDKITRSLTFDNLVSFEDLYIRPVPNSHTQITFYILIKDENNVIAFEALMNLEDGVTIGRVAYDTVS